MLENTEGSPNRLRLTVRDVLGAGGAELIESAIHGAEGCTSGEIVVRVVQTVRGAESARAAALAEFDRLRLTATSRRNGILLFISLDEHAIELVADTGIAEQVPQSTWDVAVEIVSLGFQVGEPAAAIAMAVTKVGRLLSTCFPFERSDVNELPNKIAY